MVANTTFVNTHLLTFLKEVPIDTLFKLLDHSTLPLLFVCLTRVVLAVVGVVNHLINTSFCKTIKDERLKVYAYTHSIPFIGNLLPKFQPTKPEVIKQPELPKP